MKRARLVIETDWGQELPLIKKGKRFVYENAGRRFEGTVVRSRRSKNRQKAWIWVQPDDDTPPIMDVHVPATADEGNQPPM